MQNCLTRIGVFYDGNYFLHVSNYYNYDHARRRRLSIIGLHHFIESRVAASEGVPNGYAKIVDSHYFRGRLNAQEAQQRGSVLYYDRVFDDILMSSGVTTHYSPIRSNNGRRQDKSIDVWMALEAYEQASLRKLDVVVLITSDGDYVPLVRKLNSLGCRVMVLGWDFEFTTDNGSQMVTRTSQELLDVCTYPTLMNVIIDDPLPEEEKLVEELFVVNNSTDKPTVDTHDTDLDTTTEVVMEDPVEGEVGERMESSIFSLKNGYGFIKYPPNNLFFHYSTLLNIEFNELMEDDRVSFTLTHNDAGRLIAVDVNLLDEFGEEQE